MKKNLILTALIATAILSSCSKKDDKGTGTPTPTPTPAGETRIDSTEKIMIGKWIVDKKVDSSTFEESGVMDPSYPFVFNLSTTGNYLELKSTRLNLFVGTDLKNKDAVDAIFNVAMDQYWYYDASTKILHVTNDYELLYLSKDKLVFRYKLSDVTKGTERRYRAITCHMHKE